MKRRDTHGGTEQRENQIHSFYPFRERIWRIQSISCSCIRPGLKSGGLLLPIRYADLLGVSRSGESDLCLRFRSGETRTTDVGLYAEYLCLAVSRILEAVSPEAAGEQVLTAEEAYRKGRQYETGDGVAVDMKEAVRWYTLGAEQGDVAALRLGGARREDVRAGQTITDIDGVELTNQVFFEGRLLKPAQGGRGTPIFRGYRPLLILGHASVPVEVVSMSRGEMALPGDRVTLQLELDQPMPVFPGTPGILCDNGMILAYGSIENAE